MKMAKYRVIENDALFITSVQNKTNGSNGSDYWEIHFKTIRSQEDYYTFADPSMANWRHWEKLIDSAQTKGVVISHVKVKDESKGIINADADRMKIEWIGPKETLAQELAEYWDKLAAEQGGFDKFYTFTR